MNEGEQHSGLNNTKEYAQYGVLFFFLHQFSQIKLTSNSVPSQFIMDDSLQWKNDELGLLPLDALRSIVLDEIHLLVPEQEPDVTVKLLSIINESQDDIQMFM